MFMTEFSNAGIISRSRAADIWGPNDRRLNVNGELGPEVTAPEAVAVFSGCNDQEHSKIWPIAKAHGLTESWEETIAGAFNNGDSSLEDALNVSNQRQLTEARQRRQECQDRFPEYICRLGKAILKLAGDQLLTREQATTIYDRLKGNNGQPAFADTPVSTLEYYRLGGVTSTDNQVPYTSFRSGIIVSPVGSSYLEELMAINKTHEVVHALVGGAELIAEVSPQTSVVSPLAIGLWEFDAIDPEADTAGFAANEGFTCLFARQLAKVEPALGPVLVQYHSYQAWESGAEEWRQEDPATFRLAIQAYVVDATPENPMFKRQVIAELRDAVKVSKKLPMSVKELLE